MKTKQIPPIIHGNAVAKIFVAACLIVLAGLTSPAGAQFAPFRPFSPFLPTARPFGTYGPVNAVAYGAPFYRVSPQGIMPGYLGPNGPYQLPANRFEAGFYPSGGSVGAMNSGSLYAPFNATGSLNDPSLVGPANPTGARVAEPIVNSVPIPRTNDTIDARIDKDNRLVIKWAGDPQTVTQIRFALLDKDRNVLKEERVTSLPAEARLAITSKTSYFRVNVEYVNGTSTNVVSPL